MEEAKVAYAKLVEYKDGEKKQTNKERYKVMKTKDKVVVTTSKMTISNACMLNWGQR